MIKNIRIAKALQKEGLASEFLPVLTKDSKDYLDGEHIFLLTRKVGEPLISSPQSDDEIASMAYIDDRIKHAYQLGRAIARLHRALKSIQDDVKPYEANKYQQGLDSIPKVKAYSTKYNMRIADGFYDDYTITFGELYEKLPKQLIHGNPTGDTVVYENGEIVGIKGYEIYNVSHARLFDIIWSAGEINTQSIESYLEMLKGILHGYDSISTLSDAEKQSVYYMLCAAALHGIAYVDDDTLDVLKRNLKALVFLAENKAMFFGLL